MPWSPAHTPRTHIARLPDPTSVSSAWGRAYRLAPKNTHMPHVGPLAVKRLPRGSLVRAHRGPVSGVVGRHNGLRPHLFGLYRIFEHRPDLLLQLPIEPLDPLCAAV